MEFKASYDNIVKIITSIIFFVAIFFTIKSLNLLLEGGYNNLTVIVTNIGVIIFFVILILLTWLYSPVSYILDDKYLIIKRRASNYMIELNEIKSIEKIIDDELKGTIRIFAVGGLFGYFGKYYIPSYGIVKFYATQRKNRILIETTKGEKYLITPDNISLFDELRKRL